MHIVSGLLRKATFTKPRDDGSTMFIIELSEYNKEREGDPTYTNYKAAFFPKTPAAQEHLNKALKEGNFVVIACDKLKIITSPCGNYTKLDMQFPRLTNHNDSGQAPQQVPAQQNYQQPAQQVAQQPQRTQQAPRQQPAAPQPAINNGFDDPSEDIPF